jgi:hypothetical protein
VNALVTVWIVFERLLASEAMLGTGAISLGMVSSMGLVLDSVSVSICSGESIGDENSVAAWVKTHFLLVFAGSGSVSSGCV